jgi:transposase
VGAGPVELVTDIKAAARKAPRGRSAVFTAIVFVLTSGCAWRHLPPSFGVTVPTAHRRFCERTQAGLWRRLHRAVPTPAPACVPGAWSG